MNAVTRWKTIATIALAFSAVNLFATACQNSGVVEIGDGYGTTDDGAVSTTDNGTTGAGRDSADESGSDLEGDSDWVPEDPENDGFYLHSNGVTILCPDVADGATGVVERRTYTKYNEDRLRDLADDIDDWGVSDDAMELVCTSGIRRMAFLFKWDDGFNADIRSWDTSVVMNMEGMFHGAESFNQDLSKWCVRFVELNPDEPAWFDHDAHSWTEPRPVWGTCP